MRLSLRKKLKPYQSLSVLAEDLDVTLPELKRAIAILSHRNELSVQHLQERFGRVSPSDGDATFQLFHEHGRCLVCGNEMRLPANRNIGWGEFKQCVRCGFSTHELASYDTSKEAAEKLLKDLIDTAKRTRQVLHDRQEQSRLLSSQHAPNS